jgi:protein tyrosine phosphatase
LLFFFPEDKRTVEQLHCTTWPDMEAPKDTKTLLDLFKYTEKSMLVNPGTILVHCSAGVGRTGTFIGLFKLIMDYQEKVSAELV